MTAQSNKMSASKSPTTSSPASSSPNASTTPAKDEALRTTELLEKILKSLPPKSIVAVQRVSAKWRDVGARLASLDTLGRSLSTTPEQVTQAIYWVETPTYDSNGKLIYHIYRLRSSKNLDSVGDAIARLAPVTLHISMLDFGPDHLRSIPGIIHPAFRNEVHVWNRNAYFGVSLAINPQLLLSWDPTGPWKDQYLTQPPISYGDVYSVMMGGMSMQKPWSRGAEYLTLGSLRKDLERLGWANWLSPRFSKYTTPLRIAVFGFVEETAEAMQHVDTGELFVGADVSRPWKDPNEEV